jgi:hypothetical protein
MTPFPTSAPRATPASISSVEVNVYNNPESMLLVYIFLPINIIFFLCCFAGAGLYIYRKHSAAAAAAAASPKEQGANKPKLNLRKAWDA